MTQDETRARLLDAAGREFAEKGFDQASIRDITTRAGMTRNVGAVNYHFGDKKRLYAEAVLEAHRCGGIEMDPADFRVGTPAEQLRGFIRHFMMNVLAMSGNDSWHHTLMLREMLRPTDACDVLIREGIRPKFEGLMGILGRICPGADERRLHALAFSVVGQCLHYRTSRGISERLIGAEAYAALDVDFLADHIARFCLAALGQDAPFNRADAGSAVASAN